MFLCGFIGVISLMTDEMIPVPFNSNCRDKE
jgi:hypothetical protein